MTTKTAENYVARARAGGYAVGGFNMHNPETTQALIEASIRAQSPVFLQVGRAIVPHLGLEAAYRMTRHELDGTGADAVIHLDHGTYDEVFEALRLGFDSIMFDGSHLPFEENVKTTRYVVQVAHSFGVPVEAELGSIPDASNGIDWSAHYTNVDEAERFVAETGVDFLAISAGVMHGITSGAPLPLDIDRIQRIRDVTGVPLVLHGASGVPESDISAAIAAGVHKLNADTDLRHAFRRGIEETWAHGDRQLEDALSEGKRQMIEATIAKMREYGCAGASTTAVLTEARA
ncbi:class II fructose-bisphosphate aldolase [Cryobacterium lyxosi]|uniref:Class II fructose-bisphosphate aldolase n=1 Tax=Cryobacterium lyxosi TaxID=1259228 RepID=A0A4R8ZHT7_9MICO|nr:class II fructose-bisphosphate aldolase [Cryobacterium lyxosi]TFD27661.1 class II fructose-bisphosphate aldolase [Cryobacterium lyxosi]